nr:sugar O-acetyltransferase [Corynebacterium pacaense]
MSSGQWYIPGSAELRRIAGRAAELGHEYNQIGPTDPERSGVILREWINPDSGHCVIKAPAIIEYGLNTTIGEGVFINFGLTILDICPVTIGARSMLGPNCQLLTAGHPVNDVEMRRGGWENGAPITIGEDVWFGGGVIVVGGVTIGDRAVIGAGAVVTRDIPADAIAVGNPARVIRMRDDAHQERTELPEGVPVDAWGALPW